jgi:hypothetical protein
MPSTNDLPALISEISILHRPYPDAQTCHNTTENPFGLGCPWARVEVRLYRNTVGRLSDPTHSKSPRTFGKKRTYKISQPKCLKFNLENFALVRGSLSYFYPQWEEVTLPPRSVTPLSPLATTLKKFTEGSGEGGPEYRQREVISHPLC